MKAMTRFLIKSAALILFFGSLVVGVQRLEAATIYSQSFALPHGGLPDGWVSVNSGGATASTIAITQRGSTGDWRLLLRRDSSSTQMAYYAGSYGSIASGQIANFESSVTFRAATAGPNYARGIIARASSISGVYFDGYFAYVDTNVLYIAKDPKSGAGNTKGTVIGAGVALSENLALGIDYQFTFSGVGDKLTASIYKPDGSGNYLTAGRLATVSVTDSTYSSGVFGFRTMPDGDGRGTYFSNLEIAVIPEPSTMGLSLAATAFLILQSPRLLGRRKS